MPPAVSLLDCMGFFAGFSLYIREEQLRISEAALGRVGGVQRPILRVNEPKKTGASSARARTHGQNPLVDV